MKPRMNPDKTMKPRMNANEREFRRPERRALGLRKYSAVGARIFRFFISVHSRSFAVTIGGVCE